MKIDQHGNELPEPTINYEPDYGNPYDEQEEERGSNSEWAYDNCREDK